MKDKFLHNDVGIKKANEIIYNRYFGLNWHNRTKDKTVLFTDKDNKYDKEDPKKTVKQLRKSKLCLKQKVDK